MLSWCRSCGHPLFASQTWAHAHGEGSYRKHRFAFRILPLIYLLALTAGRWGLICRQSCSVLFATQMDGGEVLARKPPTLYTVTA